MTNVAYPSGKFHSTVQTYGIWEIHLTNGRVFTIATLGGFGAGLVYPGQGGNVAYCRTIIPPPAQVEYFGDLGWTPGEMPDTILGYPRGVCSPGYEIDYYLLLSQGDYPP